MHKASTQQYNCDSDIYLKNDIITDVCKQNGISNYEFNKPV